MLVKIPLVKPVRDGFDKVRIVRLVARRARAAGVGDGLLGVAGRYCLHHHANGSGGVYIRAKGASEYRLDCRCQHDAYPRQSAPRSSDNGVDGRFGHHILIPPVGVCSSLSRNAVPQTSGAVADDLDLGDDSTYYPSVAGMEVEGLGSFSAPAGADGVAGWRGSFL
jgi:hypothetical protein